MVVFLDMFRDVNWELQSNRFQNSHHNSIANAKAIISIEIKHSSVNLRRPVRGQGHSFCRDDQRADSCPSTVAIALGMKLKAPQSASNSRGVDARPWMALQEESGDESRQDQATTYVSSHSLRACYRKKSKTIKD